MADSGNKELILPSTFEAMQRIEPFVDELKEELSLNGDNYNRIFLAISEAVNNAIVHGNSNNPEKDVRLSADMQGHELKIKVGDEGPGFNLEDIPDPLKEENLLKESGRGLFLIKQSADNVSYLKEENQLVMIFELGEK